MATHFLCGSIKGWIERMTVHLDARVSWRLIPLLTGFLFATGRRTVSSWLRAGDLSDDYQDYYYGSSPKRVGGFSLFSQISGSMHVSTLRRRYSSSLRP
jgi:hypothetical protein